MEGNEICVCLCACMSVLAFKENKIKTHSVMNKSTKYNIAQFMPN